MTPADRRENEIRRMLDGVPAPLPADLPARAAERGARLLRRRHGVHAVLWTVAVITAVLFAAWAISTQPWNIPDGPPPPVYTW